MSEDKQVLRDVADSGELSDETLEDVAGGKKVNYHRGRSNRPTASVKVGSASSTRIVITDPGVK